MLPRRRLLLVLQPLRLRRVDLLAQRGHLALELLPLLGHVAEPVLQLAGRLLLVAQPTFLFGEGAAEHPAHDPSSQLPGLLAAAVGGLCSP